MSVYCKHDILTVVVTIIFVYCIIIYISEHLIYRIGPKTEFPKFYFPKLALSRKKYIYPNKNPEFNIPEWTSGKKLGIFIPRESL